MPTESEISGLETLIQRLRDTPKMSPSKAKRLGEAFRRDVIERMYDNNQSYGVNSSGPVHLNLPEEEFRVYMKRADNDLGEQVRITDETLHTWFEYGEANAPYYPWRITVILRKAKRFDLEMAFLTAYCKHFGRNVGSRQEKLTQRAIKIGAFK